MREQSFPAGVTPGHTVKTEASLHPPCRSGGHPARVVGGPTAVVGENSTRRPATGIAFKADTRVCTRAGLADSSGAITWHDGDLACVWIEAA